MKSQQKSLDIKSLQSTGVSSAFPSPNSYSIPEGSLISYSDES